MYETVQIVGHSMSALLLESMLPMRMLLRWCDGEQHKSKNIHRDSIMFLTVASMTKSTTLPLSLLHIRLCDLDV